MCIRDRLNILLSRLAVFHPKLLLCIRPFSYLDNRATAIVCAFLEQLASDGVCVVLLGNDMSVVCPVCDRVLLVTQGRVTDELQNADLHDAAGLAQRISQTHEQPNMQEIF